MGKRIEVSAVESIVGTGYRPHMTNPAAVVIARDLGTRPDLPNSVPIYHGFHRVPGQVSAIGTPTPMSSFISLRVRSCS